MPATTEIQFTPTTPFPAGAVVQWFLSGSVLDINGDAFTGNSGTFYVAPTVNATTATPTVIAVSPSYGSSAAPTNARVDIEFSQPIKQSTVAGKYLHFSSSLAANITFPAANIVRLTPTAPFSAATTYYVCVNGSVQGTNGVAAQSSCYATYFTTTAASDSTAGTVTIGPPNSSTGVGTNAYIRLWLSKGVDATTINTTNIVITTGGNPIPGTWSYNYTNDDIREINFSPVNPLPASTPINIGVSGLLDYAGNTFTSANSSFTTAALPDYSVPSVTLDFPYGQTGVATNASFTCLYSEPMDPSSVNSTNTRVYSYVTNASIPVTYTWASDLMAVTMKPTVPLFANTDYSYQCEGAIDLTGNGQNNASALFYTGNVSSSVGPVLVQANPPNGSTNVPLNSIGGPWNNTSLMLQFNEPVSSDSMANITFTPAGGSPEPIAVYAEYGNTIADVQLPYALKPNTQYTFGVGSTVTDLNGNPATPATSSFTTGSGFDWTSPTITTPAPATGVTTTLVSIRLYR